MGGVSKTQQKRKERTRISGCKELTCKCLVDIKRQHQEREAREERRSRRKKRREVEEDDEDFKDAPEEAFDEREENEKSSEEYSSEDQKDDDKSSEPQTEENNDNPSKMSLNVDDFLSTVEEGEKQEEEYLSGGEEFLSTCESDVKVDFLSTVD